MLSRRRLLINTAKLSVLAAASAINTPRVFARMAGVAPALPLGRVIVPYELDLEPALGGPVGKVLAADTIIPLHEQVTGKPYGTHNNSTWFRTDGGFIHSAWLQLVDNKPNGVQPQPAARAGFWAQTSVPFVDLYTAPDASRFRHRLYYSSCFRVVDAVQAANGEWWYRLNEGVRGGGYARAFALRRLDDGEIAPISPGIGNKLVDVNLSNHIVTAVEDGRAVYEARCASGRLTPGYRTPLGTFRVTGKNLGAHMSGAFGTSEAYDLPGVPFTTWFTGSGVALHGAYWHFDWGAQRSHGCVNLSPTDARFFWRWTTGSYQRVGTGRRARLAYVGTPVRVRRA